MSEEPIYVSSVIMGGLGNQLFQISLVLVESWKHNYIPVFSDKPWVRLEVKLEYNKTIFKHLTWLPEDKFNQIQFNKYNEPHFHYCQISRMNSSTQFEGYFQSWRYIHDFKSRLIKELFFLSEEDREKLEQNWRTINPNNCHLVAIHVRRGDYISNSYYHTVLSLSYYEKSMKLVLGRNKNKTLEFCIFSDDLAWCKEQSLFKDCNFWTSSRPELDLLLMSKCSSFIIGNSSYSWWAAYLSNSDDVLYPDKWFGPGNDCHKLIDLYPPTWIKVIW